MLIYEGKMHKKKWSDISIRGRENHVSPKPDGHTDGRTFAFIE